MAFFTGVQRLVRKVAGRKGDVATIHDVARRAGKSPMTVSRVVSGNGYVSEKTRAIVMEAVRELNYQPNHVARSLAGATSTRIALIYSNPSSAYLSELLVGALEGASRMATQLVVETWHNVSASAERSAARKLADSTSGVILPPPLCESKAITSELIAADVPVVALASGKFQEGLSCVRVDDFRAAHEMTTYLISLGHSRIGFIKGDPNQTASARRLEGYQAALHEAGIAPDPANVQQGYFTYRSGLEASEKLLNRKRPPSAIFASNDDMAAAAISVAHRRGMDVPRDLSVVGFDDTNAATTVWPELTTIRQPIAAMAQSAIELLMRNIRRKDKSTKVVIDHVVAHQLVKRDSVAPPSSK
jgi:LacI family transcriptional regulator